MNSISKEDLRKLAERYCVQGCIQAELITLLQQIRQTEARAIDLPQPDGVLLQSIVADLEARVTSRLQWLINAEKHPPLLESASVCHF